MNAAHHVHPLTRLKSKSETPLTRLPSSDLQDIHLTSTFAPSALGTSLAAHPVNDDPELYDLIPAGQYLGCGGC